MLFSPSELTERLGRRIRERRLQLKLTQRESAERAGVAYRTWSRLESEGKASIEDLVRAAIALRCEQDLESLFPEPPAHSMNDLLDRQRRLGTRQKRRV
jgi:transcriptional regulator with XRE-family HTH domain